MRRLGALAALDAGGIDALNMAAQRGRVLRPHQDLVVEGAPITETFILLEGWAARTHQLADGRRAILNFVLPGDLVGFCEHEQPLASSTVVALTRTVVCTAPERGVSTALERAYQLSRAHHEAYLLAQIARLSRLNAYERIADLFLELLERLELAGLAWNGRYRFPLTQEIVSDVVGLSTVHVNRMLQQARKAGDLTWTAQSIRLTDPEALRQTIGRQRVRVTAAEPERRVEAESRLLS